MGLRPKNILGTRIRKLRTEQGLTLDKVARACMSYGVPMTAQVLEKIETELRSISDIELIALSLALGVSVKQIFPANPTTKIKILTSH